MKPALFAMSLVFSVSYAKGADSDFKTLFKCATAFPAVSVYPANDSISPYATDPKYKAKDGAFEPFIFPQVSCGGKKLPPTYSFMVLNAQGASLIEVPQKDYITDATGRPVGKWSNNSINYNITVTPPGGKASVRMPMGRDTESNSAILTGDFRVGWPEYGVKATNAVPFRALSGGEQADGAVFTSETRKLSYNDAVACLQDFLMKTAQSNALYNFQMSNLPSPDRLKEFMKKLSESSAASADQLTASCSQIINGTIQGAVDLEKKSAAIVKRRYDQLPSVKQQQNLHE